MASLIIVKNPYDTPEALCNVVKYVINYQKTNGFVGATGVSLLDPINCMLAVKEYYKSTGKAVEHIVLSFSPNECITTLDAFDIGYKICELFPKYQSVFGVHKDTKHLHLHIAINTTNVASGHKLCFGFQESFKLRRNIGTLLVPYGIMCDLRMNSI